MSIATLLTDAVSIWKHRPVSSLDDKRSFPDVSHAPPDSRRLIRNRQYCLVLVNQEDLPFDKVSVSCAWDALQHEMAIVPGGDICLSGDCVVLSPTGFEMKSTPDELISVDSYYLDRHCVTNAEYEKFVQAGGYANPMLWPETMLPSVLQFVDQTGLPGPKYWSGGSPPDKKANHPVVGICWYEANAYASWAGKRLPTSEEWQRAGTWSKGHSGNGAELRYPWGNAFDPSKANLWASRQGGTVSVDSFITGNTPNGVGQLVGNVWEWVDTQFYPNSEEGISVYLDEAMAEIRGGAFDTYFHSQATCQFRTGHPLLFRGPNVGFRCGISESIVSSVANDRSLSSTENK